MFSFFSHLKFLFAATNQHGVHSPFVYNYLTKCLYTSSKYKGNKAAQILQKSIAYYKVEKLGFYPSQASLEKKIAAVFPKVLQQQSPFDAIIINLENKTTIDFIEMTTETHNETFVFLEGIYQNKLRSEVWEKLKNDTRITVSVDLFYCGLLFFRKEQEKQHFKIRI